MDKTYDHTKVEDNIYKKWETGGYFQPEINPDGKPYCIVLPPPNANGALHFGHAMFTVEDILIRYHRMLGDSALWLPGTDHAGIETQFVFEKKLAASGKSRFDFSREQLYEMIKEYVDENRGGIQTQLKKLGYSLDWTREKYTMDPAIIDLVSQTFRKMYQDGLVYRDYRLVNYCTKDGTSFSDLEVTYEERINPLYYVTYGPLTLATTRPETKFGDTALAVHPDDERYKQYIGHEIEIETVLGMAKIKVIADGVVDPNFGTGVVKVTPAHDFADFEIGRRHNLPLKQVIGFDGKMNHYAGEFEGLYVKQARAAVIEKMKEKGLLVKVDENYMSRIGVCYKCKTVLEPLPLEQWYVNVQDLKKQAMEVVTAGKLNIFPKNFENPYFQWLENLRDWNISRQNVWGIRIPVWYEVENKEQFTVSFIDKKSNHHQGSLKELLEKGFLWGEILLGLQRVIAPITAKVVFEEEKEEGKNYLPETDTFDTWFSSGQWPIVTLKTAKPGDFEKFYPTAVLETAYDILKAWVSRMVMFGLYLTGEVPFKDVLFHGIVNDPLGKKMSKSKGNVINPLDLVGEYGADAVRFALIYGNATGSDQSLSYTKLDAARKFTNKLWNMARFLEMKKPEGFSVENVDIPLHKLSSFAISQPDKDMVVSTQELVREISGYLDKYQFNLAAERLYDFAWHTFADKYIEDVRLQHSLPTIEYLLKHHNRLICVAKLGRPKGRDPKLSMKVVVDRLQKYLPGYNVRLIDDFLTEDKKTFENQTDKDVYVLENIRYYPEEKANDPAFAKKLASLADIYVNDAFAVSHRKEASLVGVPKYLPSFAGLSLAREVTMIDKAVKNPKKPMVAIIGGAKISTKLPILGKLLELADYLILGGGLANTFFCAEGFNIGKSYCELAEVENAKQLLFMAAQRNTMVLLPSDVIVGDPKNTKHAGKVYRVNEIPEGGSALDIGPETKARFGAIISKAKTIIWNGPMGIFENPAYRQGTDFIYFSIAHNPHAVSVVGGGDTLNAIQHKHHLEKITHISTGGGAMLEFIENGTLPALEALKKK